MQKKSNSNFIENSVEEASLKDLILGARSWIRYFLSKWHIILLFSIVGAVLGVAYAFIRKPVYTATTSFVLETGSSKSGLAAYAGLASSFGIDLGVTGGGLFEGDNILELYKSRNMISRTLLSRADFNGKKQLLIERFIEFNELHKKWNKYRELQNIQFNEGNAYSTPRQQLIHDSIISVIVKDIEKKYLNVDKIDKKLNIIDVTVASKDELFAKYLNEKLVENVNNFYLNTKTKKALENVNILQHKTDSVRGLMTGAINRAVVIADATPNQNLTRMAQRVGPIQNATANVEINKEVLGTLLQNLELSKISMLKEAPLIQIVDEPVLPLEKDELGKLKGLILGGIISCMLIITFLFIKKFLNNTLYEE